EKQADLQPGIWKLAKNQKALPHVAYLSMLKRHTAPVNVVRFSPNGELLASAGDDGVICLWKLLENNDSTSSFGEDFDGGSNRDPETWK
ncbi:10932_t:CDS:2, partial [Acaulospora morrowiae]